MLLNLGKAACLCQVNSEEHLKLLRKKFTLMPRQNMEAAADLPKLVPKTSCNGSGRHLDHTRLLHHQ